MNKVILGNYISQIRGISYQPNDISKTQSVDFVPILKANNITDDGIDDSDLIFIHKSKVRPEQLIRKGDILIVGSSGSKDIVGRGIEFHSDYNGSFGAFCKLIRVTDHNLDYNYLYFFFKTKFYKEILKRSLQGININNLRNENIDSIAIPLPPLAEQKKIVAILQEADALCRKKIEILEKSNRLASALFLEMFGDPVRNEMGWDIKKLREVTRLIADIDHKMPKAVDAGIPFISAKDLLDNGKLSFDDVKYVSEEDFIRLSRKVKPERGDIIYSRIGAKLGKARLVNVDFDFLVSYSCCTIKPKLDIVNNSYLCHIMDSPFLLKQAKKGVQAIGVPDLGLDEIKNFKIPLPPLPLQNDFAKKVEAIEDTTKQIESSLHKMEKLYDSLLQKAFTGDLTKEWRKRNPDVKDNNVKSKKIQLQAFEFKQPNIKEDVIKEETPPSQSSPRLWLKKQLSEEQKLVLDKWRNWGNFPITPQTSGFKDLIEEVVYEGQGMKAEEKKEIVIRILNQLVGIGFAEKISVQTSEYGYITGYRYLGEKDRSKTKDSDISLLKSKKAE